jgi:hypothetical protein
MDTLPVVDWLTLNTIYTLASPITVFQTFAEEDSDRCGPICELPEGADLQVCGRGFSKRAVKVQYGDSYYHVFWRDLESAAIGDQSATVDEQLGLLRLAEMLENQSHAPKSPLFGVLQDSLRRPQRAVPPVRR